MQENTPMHVFRTHICTKYHKPCYQTWNRSVIPNHSSKSTKEYQRCSTGYLFNNTPFTLRCESQRKYITCDFAAQQRTTISDPPGVHWVQQQGQNAPGLNNLHLRRTRTQSVAGLWFLPLLEQGHRLKFRLDSPRLQAHTNTNTGVWKLKVLPLCQQQLHGSYPT